MFTGYKFLGAVLIRPSITKYYIDKIDLNKLNNKQFISNISNTLFYNIYINIINFIDKIKSCIINNKCFNLYSNEFTKILINNYKKIICSPYESTYRTPSKAKIMIEMPIISESLNNFYKKFNYIIDKNMVPSSDHISVELQFLSLLHAAMAGIIEINLDYDSLNNLRIEFLRKHVYTWVPVLANCIYNNSKSTILKEIGLLINNLLDHEKYF